jgi:hypothetical protein
MSDTIKEEQSIAGQEHAEGSEDSSSAVRRRSSFEGRESKRQRQSTLVVIIATFPVAATSPTTTTISSPRNFFPSTVSFKHAHLLLLNRHTVFLQEVLPTRTSPWLTSNLNLKAPKVSHPHLCPSS